MRAALLQGESSPVTFVALRPNTQNEISVGYQDGSIGIFNIDRQERTVLLQGHRRAVNCLRFWVIIILY